MLRTSVSAPNFRRMKIRPRRQKGYLLVELGLVLIVSTMLLAGQFSKIIDAVNQLNAESTASYLKEVQGGVNRYIEENLQALKTGNAVGPGFPTPLQPTIAQLQNPAFKYLDARLFPTSALDLPFKIVLTRDPACNTNADDPACVISGIAHSTAAYRQDGQVRSDVLATAISAIGKDGAMSYAEAPAVLRFQGGTTMPNPVANTPGILAIRVGNHSGLTSLLAPYYRLDGSKKLTGSMNAGGFDIGAVRNLAVTEATTTKDLTVSGLATLATTAVPGSACGVHGSVARSSNESGLVVCRSGTWSAVGTTVPGVADGVPCSNAGQLGTDGGSAASYVCNGSYWMSQNTTANAGDTCAPAGRTATAINNREQLVCSNGRFVRLANLLSKQVEIARVLVTDNQNVGKPACETGGTPTYSFHLTQTVVDVSVTPPRQAMYIAASDNGSTWGVKIRVKDNTGAEVSASNYSISAVMKLECAY
jgi:type II secretory pathway pseudopilin PulG